MISAQVEGTSMSKHQEILDYIEKITDWEKRSQCPQYFQFF